MADVFDYVIVGAGSAGCILANRLSADGKSTVCLLEAGPPDRSIYIHLPSGFVKNLGNPRIDWMYEAEAGPKHRWAANAGAPWQDLGRVEFNQRHDLQSWAAARL